jgi:hypothetical protein
MIAAMSANSKRILMGDETPIVSRTAAVRAPLPFLQVSPPLMIFEHFIGLDSWAFTLYGVHGRILQIIDDFLFENHYSQHMSRVLYPLTGCDALRIEFCWPLPLAEYRPRAKIIICKRFPALSQDR